MSDSADPLAAVIAEMRSFARKIEHGQRRATRRFVVENTYAAADKLESVAADHEAQVSRQAAIIAALKAKIPELAKGIDFAVDVTEPHDVQLRRFETLLEIWLGVWPLEVEDGEL